MFSLENRIAVITGGGSGIGRAIAALFAKQGAIVHIIEINSHNAAEILEEINSSGGKAQAYSCDVRKQDEVVSVFEKIGKVDILVNNAGIAHVGRADNTSPEDFDRIISVNIKGVYNCLHTII